MFFLSNKEKWGDSIVRDPFRERMEDLIADWDLVDVKPTKGKYSWSNRRLGPGHIAARLDRFLIHGDLLLCDQLIPSKIIPSSVPDHKPISLFFYSLEI